ncbi:MAG: hypothetical protein CMD87_05980 [Gammaproteobacteria bacterium]|nr:hypothetical protein [Gammaproteobacteria bacterium]|tara:strand:- start:2303 stop:4339 length:2037 start_codon:yes stop_codon:yes gene_type:complete
MAKIEDYKVMDEGDILKALELNIKSAVGYYDSELSQERKKVTEYYNAEKPKPAHDGNSKYVSQDVWSGVQSMSALLLETFAAGNRIVRFAPQNPDDVQTAEICSAYTDYVLHRQNDFFDVAQQVILDGLMARVGVCKIFWEMMTETQEEEFDNLTEDELDLLLSEEDLELIDSDTNEIGLMSGTVERKIDASKVCILPVSPEEFIIEAQAASLDTVDFCAHRTRKSLSELRDMGYDEDKISLIGTDHEDVELETDPEILARFEQIGGSRKNHAHGYIDQVREVLVYEAYINLDPEATGTASLYKVVKAGNQILEMEKVDRRPFICFTPLPIAHSFYGSNFAAKLIATQNAKTVLTRSILDHAVITNNPRYMVVKGGLTNPRELISNRVGGLVNVSRPDAISPMPQANLNPFIFQTIGMLDDDKEDTSSISRLSQGLNKDAVSKQNSAAMVEQLATMSQQRAKIIARNFANQFLKPLFHEAYRLIVENEQEEKVVDIAGGFVQIDPRNWKEKRDVMVEMKLGYGEQERESQKYLSLHTLMTQDPSLQPLYGIQNRYNMMKQILEQQGILNVNEYLTSPEQLPPPQPDQSAQMQMQLTAKQMELQERQTAVAEQKVATQAEQAAAKMELDAVKAQSQFALQSDQQDLREAEFEHKVKVDEGELELLKTTEDRRGIVSPTG